MKEDKKTRLTLVYYCFCSVTPMSDLVSSSSLFHVRWTSLKQSTKHL